MARFENSIDQDPVQTGLPAEFIPITGSSSFLISETQATVTSHVLTSNGGGSSASTSFYWATPGTAVTDGQLLALFRFTTVSTTTVTTLLTNTVRGATDSIACASFTLLDQSLTGLGSSNISIVDISSASVTTTIVSTAFAWTVNTWYWVRFSAQGTTYSGTIWPLGSSEPSAATLSGVSATRTVGPFGSRAPSTWAGANNHVEIAWLSAATGTDIAPGPGFAPNQNMQILDGAISIKKILGY